MDEADRLGRLVTGWTPPPRPPLTALEGPTVRLEPLSADLHAAVRFARHFEPDVLLEETVPGEDLRVILVGGELAAAIRRAPAAVTGDGVHTLRQLILRRNASRRHGDPSNLIPWNAETRRNLVELGRHPDEIPACGEQVRVRLTNNYHTGGKAWKAHGVTADRVLARNQHMAEGAPQLWAYTRALLADAVAKGYLPE